MYKYVFDFFKMKDVEYREAVKMNTISSVRIGGEADVVAYPHDENMLIELVKLLKNEQIPYKIIGRMSNVLPSDKKYNGVLIKTDRINRIMFDNDRVVASAGVSLPTLSMVAEKIGLSGMEELSGIPGSIAGAIIGNAGAFGKEICDIVKSVKYFDIENAEINCLATKDCGFEYRSSFFKNYNAIILSVELCLTESLPFKVRERMNVYKEKRMLSQPCGVASLGSTFKRPCPDISAGKLIDDCGLKGFCIGDAEISSKHAGVVVNKGTASAEDYLAVSNYARKAVFDKFAVNLEYEIEIM